MIYRFLLVLSIAGMLMLPASTILSQSNPPEDDPNIVIHIVQRGENLFRIALNYGLTTDEIALANNITNPGSILVGQRLIIPLNGLPSADTETPETHIIQPGETLQRIAESYGLTTDILIQLNAIENPNRIYVGQVLRISGELVEPDLIDVIHVVQRGDNLSSIAQYYGVTMESIQQANDIADPSRILVGQQITIPDVRPVNATSNLPAFVTSLNLRPLSFIEGQTGLIRLTTVNPATVTGSFLDKALVIIQQDNATTHLMFVSIPVFTPQGVYPASITVAQSTGETAQIDFNIQVVSGGYASQYITLPEDKVPLLAPAVEQNEMAILTNVMAPFTAERYYNGTMSLPAAAAMNSPFGTIRSYNGGAFDHYHNGADFAGAAGTPIYAAAAGRVVLADTLNIRGVSVIIDHGWGVYTNYSHMTERYVNIGEFVQSGQVIGTVGNTGRATGAHLHWEVWVNGVAVDPMQWVRESFP